MDDQDPLTSNNQVLVIGGGVGGIKAAMDLSEAGRDVLLIDKALGTSRFDAEPWAMRGFVYAKYLNDRGKARAAYELALSLDPGNSEYERALLRLETPR